MNEQKPPTQPTKKYTSYIFEGLMIFLAVLMGFFAENLREEKAELNKERQFIRSLVENLKADSITFINRDSALRQRIAFMDTLNYLLATRQKNRNAEAYLLARFATRITQFKPGQSTLNYLSKSNTYASIADGDVKNSIQTYEEEANWMQNLIKVEEDQGLLLYPLIAQIFDASVFLTMNQTGFHLSSFKMPTGNPPLLSDNPLVINQLVYHLYLRRSQFFSQTITQNRLEKKRRELITFLEDKYALQ